jgi:tetratricopeptide (TPR) repeat protein
VIRVSIVAVVAVTATAHADRFTAEDRKVRAAEAYDKHHYIGARLELLAGIAIEPRAEFWFALGQTDYNLGRYADAIDAWKRYLDTRPGEDEAARTQQAIGAANAKLHLPPPVIPPPPPELERRWDGWDTALVVVGAVAAGAGAGTVYHARTLGDDGSGTFHDYDRRLHTAHEYQVAGFAAVGVGAVAIVGALWRWRVHYEEIPRVGVTVSASGASVFVGGSL